MSATPSTLGDYLQPKILSERTNPSRMNVVFLPASFDVDSVGEWVYMGMAKSKAMEAGWCQLSRFLIFAIKHFVGLLDEAMPLMAELEVDTRSWQFRGIHSRQSIRIPCSLAGKMLDPGMVTWYDYRQPTTLYEPQAPTQLSLSQIGQKSQMIRRAELHVRELPPLNAARASHGPQHHHGREKWPNFKSLFLPSFIALLL